MGLKEEQDLMWDILRGIEPPDLEAMILNDLAKQMSQAIDADILKSLMKL